ncbi:unnamed protein product, partial [Symbiodinium microadriaticum]
MASAGASCESGPNDLRATDGEGAEERLVHPKLVVGVRIVDCNVQMRFVEDGEPKCLGGAAHGPNIYPTMDAKMEREMAIARDTFSASATATSPGSERPLAAMMGRDEGFSNWEKAKEKFDWAVEQGYSCILVEGHFKEKEQHGSGHQLYWKGRWEENYQKVATGEKLDPDVTDTVNVDEEVKGEDGEVLYIKLTDGRGYVPILDGSGDKLLGVNGDLGV